MRARQQNDRSACAEHNWSRSGCDLPAGLELQWLGTAGFRLSYEGYHLLIDPYLTRLGLWQVFSRRRRVGECIDSVLVDLHPVGDTQFLTDVVLHFTRPAWSASRSSRSCP